MANTRHVVVVRRDLNLSAGLLAAQVAHISDQFMRKRVLNRMRFYPYEKEWMKEPYLSVLAVNTPEELALIARRAIEAGISTHRWEDVIPSEILRQSIKVIVGVSLGPDDFDKIKLITGNLPLF